MEEINGEGPQAKNDSTHTRFALEKEEEPEERGRERERRDVWRRGHDNKMKDDGFTMLEQATKEEEEEEEEWILCGGGVYPGGDLMHKATLLTASADVPCVRESQQPISPGCC